ncbi:MAG: ABC transporter ATP-binding protein [Ferrimicrobium sp.]
MLAINNLSVRFGGVVAIAGVSVELNAGISGIVGPNGAGKSTFLNCISGLGALDGGLVRGTIIFDGVDLHSRRPSDRAALGIGRSFQHPLMVPTLTVTEHLLAATGRMRRAKAREKISEVIDLVGLGAWVGKRSEDLPYGILKLLDIARAMVNADRLLLCDEPLSGLDESSRESMIELLVRVASLGARVVVVEHDFPRLARIAEEVLVLDLGQVLASGTAEEVRSLDSVRTAFLGEAIANQDHVDN